LTHAPSHRWEARQFSTLTKPKGLPVMFRPISPVLATPSGMPPPLQAPKGLATRQSAAVPTEEYFARLTAFGPANCAIEALLDWVEGRP
jgi:hypothetical protein